ncbi:MAG: class II glutamine amidotransferase [Deltaproteobacteria bacterium]|nr:class II glutamine amidotransferase [Deltaproteobacteria bacterium]
MARLFGFIGNRSDISPHVLMVERQALVSRVRAKSLGWGFGFYQGGEVLLRRRPLDEHEVVDVATLTRDVRTDMLIGHVRNPTIGEHGTRNTHPFRYRQWLFAHAGTLARFDNLRERLVTSIPDFLMRNVRGDTDSELVFHLFLSFLHDAGKLTDTTPAAEVIGALRTTLALVDRLSSEEGAEDAGPTGILVSNGEYIVGLTRGTGMAYRVIHGQEDIEALLPEDALRRSRLPDLARVRFTIVAAEFDEQPTARWKALPDCSTVVLGRYDEPSIESF